MYRNDVPGNGRAFACSTADDIADRIAIARSDELDGIVQDNRDPDPIEAVFKKLNAAEEAETARRDLCG
jgi:hypothetical protein